MDWTEQDWKAELDALEAAVKALREAQRTMLSREMGFFTKAELVNTELHRSRRAIDRCSAAMELEMDELVPA